MAVIPFCGVTPKIHESVFLAPDAWVTGDVSIGENVSIFFGAVLRGDILPITVGAGSNLQEQSMLHTSHGLTPCIVGRDVTVGHHAIIHGATVSDRCIIGMGAVILDGAEIGCNCIIGAQSLVPMNMKVPECSLALGVPAKVVRKLTAEEIQSIAQSAASYRKTGGEYRRTLAAPAR